MYFLSWRILKRQLRGKIWILWVLVSELSYIGLKKFEETILQSSSFQRYSAINWLKSIFNESYKSESYTQVILSPCQNFNSFKQSLLSNLTITYMKES